MNCRAWNVNRNFVVSLKAKILAEWKFWLVNFTKKCLKWSMKRQTWSANRDSWIANSNPGFVNIQVSKWLTNIKEKWSTIDLMFLFFYFLHSNIPDKKCHKQKWCMLFFTHIKLVAHVLASACPITHIKWIRLCHYYHHHYLIILIVIS